MRNNAYINYQQIGLDYQLYASYIIFNIALCYIILDDIDRGMRYFQEALDAAPNDDSTPDLERIRDGLRYAERAPEKLYPYEVPSDCIYRPQEDNVKNAGRIDFLGKSKVVAGIDRKDAYAGFSGRQVKVMHLM